MEIFSADGQHQEPVLKDAKIFGLGFLSDDRYVLLDYSKQYHTVHTRVHKIECNV